MFSWLKGKKPRSDATGDTWDLGSPLLHWARDDAWTIGNSAENCLIVGANGAGKTSASGRTIALASLRAGFGALINTVKADDVELWKSYASEAGRSEDLIVVEPGGPWKFNPLDFEMKRRGPAAGICENLVNLFEAVMELADRNGSHGGEQGDQAYWRLTKRQLVRNAAGLLIAAGEPVSIDGLYRVVTSAGQSMDEVRSESWRSESECFRLARVADQRPKTAAEERDFAIVCDFWFSEFPKTAPRTRSITVSCFTSQIDVMQRGILHSLFGGETTFTPEETQNGRIIVVGLPTKEFREAGIIANLVLKYCWQRSIEARDVRTSPRPCLWWADEFQALATSTDAQFLSTSRSVRAPACLMTQNVPGVHAALGGGDKGRAEADAMFALCGTKILHANSDPVTNTWAAGLIGRSRQLMQSGNSSYPTEDLGSMLIGIPGFRHGGQTTSGFSETYEYEVQPSIFTRLRTGGPANGWNVDAILFQNGKMFRQTGRTWMPVTFRQRN